jgi:catechol 2,3-dioxygenase-like lactoylglutathione lyase family enzyme
VSEGKSMGAEQALPNPQPPQPPELPQLPELPRIEAVGFPCADAEASAAFFCDGLGFRFLEEELLEDPSETAPFALEGARLRRLRLGAGEEWLDLLQVLDPGEGRRPPRPIPPDSRSCDLLFQHLCLVTPDLEALHARLEPLLAAGMITAVSAAPQRLPDWNTAAAGIRAYKFRDPDGHNLELLQFPSGKGDARWHPAPGTPVPLLLGIDHSAIAIADTERTRAFYASVLALAPLASGENSGPEQDRLDGLEDTRVRITPLRCPRGMGIETLEYLAPNRGRPRPADLEPQDPASWHIRFVVRDLEGVGERAEACGGRVLGGLPAGRRGLRLADPDGHGLLVIEAAAPGTA